MTHTKPSHVCNFHPLKHKTPLHAIPRLPFQEQLDVAVRGLEQGAEFEKQKSLAWIRKG